MVAVVVVVVVVAAVVKSASGGSEAFLRHCPCVTFTSTQTVTQVLMSLSCLPLKTGSLTGGSVPFAFQPPRLLCPH